jgi:hypothetical protein
VGARGPGTTQHPATSTRWRHRRCKARPWPDTVEVDRVIPPTGNMTVGPQQFWLSTARPGQKVTLWIDATTVHLSIGGWQIKTVPSR